MNTITMWLESPQKAGELEFDADELTHNLEDLIMDIFENGFDTF